MAGFETSSMEKALAQLTSVSHSNVDLDSIVKGAEESLKFIEPLSQATSDHPIVLRIIEDVQRQGLAYSKSIDISISTASDGGTISDDAIDLCELLLSNESDREDLVEYISEIRSIAQNTHKAAKETSEHFRNVRRHLFQIAKHIPEELARLEATRNEDAKGPGKSGNRLLDRIKLLGKPNPLDRSNEQEGHVVDHDLDNAIAQLGQAMNGLIKLTESVDRFASWWMSLDTALYTIEHSTSVLQPGSKLRTKTIAKRWKEIKSEYRNYELSIIGLRDSESFRLPSAHRNNVTIEHDVQFGMPTDAKAENITEQPINKTTGEDPQATSMPSSVENVLAPSDAKAGDTVRQPIDETTGEDPQATSKTSSMENVLVPSDAKAEDTTNPFNETSDYPEPAAVEEESANNTREENATEPIEGCGDSDKGPAGQDLDNSAVERNESENPFNDVDDEELTDDGFKHNDIIVAVMGITGSGKSNLIDLLSGQRDKRVGHALQSFTSGVEAVRIRGNIENSDRLVLVDTPGFDDTNQSDYEILKLIGEWLSTRYQRGTKLSGILYMHRITDNRMAGSPCRNLQMFANLCGSNAARHVTLVTTMWDTMPSGTDNMDGLSREDELKKRYWKTMMHMGSKTFRFTNTQGSAWELMKSYLASDEREPVLLQEELVDLGKQLNETEAGKTIYYSLLRLLTDQKNAMSQLVEQAATMDDPKLKDELEAEQRRIQELFDKTTAQVEKLKISFGRWILLIVSSSFKWANGRPVNLG